MIAILTIVQPWNEASAAPQNHEEIGSLAAVRRLYLDDQRKSIPELPVDLEVEIYYIDREWNLFFVGDPTGTLRVKVDWRFAPYGLRQGEHIRITGHTNPGKVMPFIKAQKISRIPEKSINPIPLGPRVDLKRFDTFRDDCAAARVELEVSAVYKMHDRTFLQGLSGGRVLRTVLPKNLERYTPDEILGATIIVNGVLASMPREESADHSNFVVFANTDRSFSIIEPPARPLPDAQYLNIGEIVSGGSTGELTKSTYISTAGTVLSTTSGGLVMIGDGESSVSVRMSKPWHKVKRGDYAHVNGFIAMKNGNVVIEANWFSRLGSKKVPTSREIELDQIDEIAHGMRINTKAFMVEGENQDDPQELLVATAPGLPPVARVKFTIPQKNLKNLKTDEIVSADFKATLRRGEPGETLPTLTITTLDNITVTARDIPTQQNYAWIKSVAWILASCALLTSALFLWVFTLRRQVAIRTTTVRKNARKLMDTAEKLRAAKLAEAQVSARLRDIYRSVDDGILVVDTDGKTLEANPSFTRIFELKRNPLDLDATDLREALAKRMENPSLFTKYWQDALAGDCGNDTTDWELLSGPTTGVSAFTAPVFTPKDPSGHTSAIDTLASSTDGKKIVGHVWVFRDLTKQRQLEQSLVQAQKMEAVGRLAGGIAHDFNNLLTGVTGSLGVARKYRDKPLADSEHLLETAESAARRAAELVQSLLGFSRQSSLHLKPGNPSDVIRRLQALVRHSFDAKIDVECIIDPELWIANLDSTHLEQVLLNMCVNAKDAMSEGGTITIQAKNNPTAHRTPADDGENCIELIVEDTGTGIAPEHLATIFEPFFTTKEQGKGTGLGLAMSYGIIEQHGGWITCESTVPHGTSFHIFLPRYTGKLNGLDVKPKSNTTLLPPPTHRPTLCEHTPSTTPDRPKHVLIVDDEAVVRAVAEGLFRNSGFKVSSAENGRLALDHLASIHAPGTSTSGHVDAIILDLTMPVLSGKETLRELRRLYPEIPVVIASGYLVDPVAFTNEAGASPDAFMQKPYELDEILEVVTTIIARSEQAVALPS